MLLSQVSHGPLTSPASVVEDPSDGRGPGGQSYESAHAGDCTAHTLVSAEMPMNAQAFEKSLAQRQSVTLRHYKQCRQFAELALWDAC